MNWSLSIKIPITPEIKGILNFLLYIGNFVSVIWPFEIEHCGTVEDINGSNVPLVKKGVNKEVKPKLEQLMVWFWVVPFGGRLLTNDDRVITLYGIDWL